MSLIAGTIRECRNTVNQRFYRLLEGLWQNGQTTASQGWQIVPAICLRLAPYYFAHFASQQLHDLYVDST